MKTVSPIASRFFASAARNPGKAALHCDAQVLTYADLARRTQALCLSLASRNVAEGDAVGIMLPNLPEFVVLMMASAALGLLVVPINPTMPASAAWRSFAAGDVKHIVAKRDVLRGLNAARGDHADIGGGLWIGVDGAGDDFLNFAQLAAPQLADDAAASVWLPAIAGDAPYILTMTSGSTGNPKPILLTQTTKINRANAAIEMYGVTADDITLAATPLYHSLAERLVNIPLLTGGTSVLMSRFSASEWLKTVREHKVSFTIAVSSQLGQIAQALETEEPPKSLRCVVSSSAQIHPELKAQLLAKLPCEFHECYGASEIAIASNLSVRDEVEKLVSVGRAAHGVDIQILRDDGTPAKLDELGEIACRTSMLFGGYFKQPKITAEAMWGEYFKTGDMGRLDEQGYLYYLGRKKEIIITGGINVYPADIETAAREYPGVSEAVAVSIPDDRLGEIAGLALVVRDQDNFSLRSFRHHCARALADFQQPREFLIVDAIPLSALGKVDRRAVKELFHVRPA